MKDWGDWVLGAKTIVGSSYSTHLLESILCNSEQLCTRLNKQVISKLVESLRTDDYNIEAKIVHGNKKEDLARFIEQSSLYMKANFHQPQKQKHSSSSSNTHHNGNKKHKTSHHPYMQKPHSSNSSSTNTSNVNNHNMMYQASPSYLDMLNPPMRNVLLEADKNQPRTEHEGKEEPPSWESLQPMTDLEKESVKRLSKLGFSMQKSLETLRASHGDPVTAYSRLCEELRDLQEAKLMDDAALASEQSACEDIKRAAEENEMLLKYSDVIADGHFSKSMFLDDNIGVAEVKKILTLEKDGVFDLSEADFRDLCLKLLTIEGNAIRWYGLGACSYIYTIILKLKHCSPLTYEKVEKILNEFETTLYEMPEKSGEMPPRFIEALDKYPLHVLKAKSKTCFVAASTVSKDDTVEVQPVSMPQTSNDEQTQRQETPKSNPNQTTIDLT